MCTLHQQLAADHQGAGGRADRHRRSVPSLELGAEFGAGLSDAERMIARLPAGPGHRGDRRRDPDSVRADPGRAAGRLLPPHPVHGMLASIGLIIIAKQIYEVLGPPRRRGPGRWSCSPGCRRAFNMNPEIAVIGVVVCSSCSACRSSRRSGS